MDTISINRGDIVLLDFGRPASQDDHTAAKTRPALVIQNNVANRNSPVTIVATITTNPKVELLPVGVRLEPGQTGLAQTSYVDLGHIYTVNKISIKKVIGSVHRIDITKIDCALGISLGIKEYPL